MHSCFAFQVSKRRRVLLFPSTPSFLSAIKASQYLHSFTILSATDFYKDLEHKVFVLLKMSLCSNAQSTEVGHCGRRNASSDNESLSPETSLSLGSEIDGLDGEVGSRGKTFDNSLGVNSLKPTSEDNVSESDYIDVLVGDLSNTAQSQKPVIDLEIEDTVCTCTRACYSLASFTLDELNAFLQETDDDDDFQIVDDEGEYRKFLAAILNSGDGDGQLNQKNEIVDDEDEDNDADFEIEIQELLENDVDESTRDKTQKEYGGAGRRPETRQNRRQ
ncbi:hypothetical protein CMV_008271 [Castanea mollissima]|uniref:Uncharacterized protein n=1 Tax=Castanea mollissima TaxID=60419 RepID=A0A8J4VZN7_9ROSI|nr:hypothetical protein CMV_008271 [Castanea mollissima]